jgi:hypothetical protein
VIAIVRRADYKGKMESVDWSIDCAGEGEIDDCAGESSHPVRERDDV